jgi:hypothetical protein
MCGIISPTMLQPVCNPTPNLVAIPERRRDIWIEKNLITLGFFTPSSKRLVGAKAKKVRIVRKIDGKSVETVSTIIPAALYGLPITTDQDKFLAFQEIITEQVRKVGRMENPVGFKFSQLRNILGQKKGGRINEEIIEWMRTMTATSINASVYFAGRKMWMHDTFHVFDRAVSLGMEMPDGHVADQNYIWLSEWQIENINAHFQYPIDLGTYFQLKNHIAKGLAPHLQIWLHASIRAARFEKNYQDLSELLSVRQYTELSRIKASLGPSLDELTKHGYLANWSIERNGGGEYKLVFWHGAKFFKDRERSALSLPNGGTNPRFELLVNCGIAAPQAAALLAEAPEDQAIEAQIAWWEWTIKNDRSIKRPTGFLVYLIRNGVQPPIQFLADWQRSQHEQPDDQSVVEKRALKQRQEIAYAEYRYKEADRFVKTRYDQSAVKVLLKEKARELEAFYPGSVRMTDSQKQELLVQILRRDAEKESLELLSFDEFCERYSDQLDLFLPA